MIDKRVKSLAEAVAGIADGSAPTLDAALAGENLSGATRTVEDYTWGEQIARFATDPWVSSLLLTIGIIVFAAGIF